MEKLTANSTSIKHLAVAEAVMLATTRNTTVGSLCTSGSPSIQDRCLQHVQDSDATMKNLLCQ